jgi:hypothetical protein
MAVRVVIGAIVGGIVLFLWGFLFWAVLPLGTKAVDPLPNEKEVTALLQKSITASAVYVFPAPADPEVMDEDFLARHKAGPVGQLFYQQQGSDPMAPTYLVRGFGYMVALGLLMSLLMMQAAEALGSYARRVVFVTVAGIFASGVAFSGAVWWEQPMTYHLVYLVFNISSWLLAGLAMAAVVKPAES